jgi:tetrahydromethanopterin S-methyltransferase subunit G
MRLFFSLVLTLSALAAHAVEVAPRISDREIIEALAELKAGQKMLADKMDQRFAAIDQRFADMQAQIEQRFAAMQAQIEQRFVAVDQRFAAMNQRFAAIDQRFADMQAQIEQRFAAVDQRFAAMDQRFVAVDQRFDSLEKRLDFIQNLLLALIAGVFGLIGFVVWDRYSTLRPMDLRIRRLEEDLERDLELKSAEGSRLTRLIHALRELAKTDERLAAILKDFRLL